MWTRKLTLVCDDADGSRKTQLQQNFLSVGGFMVVLLILLLFMFLT